MCNTSSTVSESDIPEIYTKNIDTLLKELGIPPKLQENYKTEVSDILFGKLPEKQTFYVIQGIFSVDKLNRFKGEKLMNDNTVWTHMDRIAKLINEQSLTIQQFFPTFDTEKCIKIGKLHDLPEWMTPFGDIPTPDKERLSQSSEDLLKYIDILCWKVMQKVYKFKENYLEEYEERETIESQIVKYNDFIDAFMTAILEYKSGNTKKFWGIISRYQERLTDIKMGKNLPLLQPLLTKPSHPFFDIQKMIDFSPEENQEFSSYLEWEKIYLQSV